LVVDHLAEAREREVMALAKTCVVEPVIAAAVIEMRGPDAPDPPPRLVVVSEETVYVFEIALRPFAGLVDGQYLRVGPLVASGKRSDTLRGRSWRGHILLTFSDGSEVELAKTRRSSKTRALELITLG
jgi:hypothetical protein